MRDCVFRAAIVASVIFGAAAGSALGQIEPRDEVFYQFMPIAWRDSDNDAQRFGDFGGMEASLDYLQSLGITAIWMNPIFPSPAYHGYQHGPADQLNPRFGTEPQWISFVEAAHARGIKVFIDFVVYGISQDSTWYQSAYNNPASPYDSWLAFTNGSNTSYLGSVYNTWNAASVGFIHWDLRTPATSNMVTNWAEHWLDPNGDLDFTDGVDGYRLDHVWVQYGSGPDGWGYNLDDFWEPWKAALQAVNPDVFTFAEQADWGITGASLLTAFDASMTKPFEFAARDALANGTATPLYDAMRAAWASVPAGRTFMGIIGDHDVDRLGSVIGSSVAKGRAAAAVLLTQPFPPMIYYGDEIGMLGTKGNYGSDANDIPMREPFKWNAVAGPPMSNYWILNAQAYNNAFSQNNDTRSVEEQEGVNGSLLESYRDLIGVRLASEALRRGSYIEIPASSSRIWAFVRQSPGQDVLVAINVSNSSRTFTLDLSSLDVTGGSTIPVDLVTGASLASLTTANKASYGLTIGANSYVIAELDLDPYTPPVGIVDGRDIPIDFAPNAATATQDTPTALGDNLSELNQMYVAFDPDGLRIGITGNLATDATGICLLVDAGAGGQNVLDFTGATPPPGGPDQLTGLDLDAGFEPEKMMFVNAFNGNLYTDWFTLLNDGGISKVYRGNGAVNAGNGFLSGGTNPNGLEVALDNSNTAGVTGVSAAAAATATTGFEIYLPFADIGLSSGAEGPIGLAAFLMKSDGTVSNQWLPGIGGGTTNLGIAPNMTTIAGTQYAVVTKTPPPIACAGDIDGDSDTDIFDFAIIAANFGLSVTPGTGGDLDGSGIVDVLDFGAFAGDFGCVP